MLSSCHIFSAPGTDIWGNSIPRIGVPHKLSSDVVNSYEMYEPPLVAIPPPLPDAPVYVPPYRAQNDEDADG